MTFDPRIQVQATLTKRSWLDVDVPPYALREQLAMRVGVDKKWFKLDRENTYGCQMLLQVLLGTASGTRVVTAEALLEQIALVQGYDGQALLDVVETQLPTILLPYARAQVASLLQQAGFQHATLPFPLPNSDARAVKVDALTREPVVVAEELTP